MTLLKKIRLAMLLLVLLSFTTPGEVVGSEHCHGESVVPGCTEYCETEDCFAHHCCGDSFDDGSDGGSAWGHCEGMGWFEYGC